ncbi:MAG: hypothetical protein HN413_10465 [Chloroflexi bacterium]|jgi:nickel-type superoxide dismutase maturation protease|nr:hypothetical protein [Chloroflexota bacterium]
MLKIIKVTGESLSPRYQTGDYVLLATNVRVRRLRSGDVIVFRHEIYGRMIKRVEHISPDGAQIFVTGTHPHSIDSATFGPISPTNLIGKAIWHIRKPR